MNCSKCGKEIVQDGNFCVHCGSAVAKPAAEPAKAVFVTSRRNNIKALLWLLVPAYSLFALVGIQALVAFIYKSTVEERLVPTAIDVAMGLAALIIVILIFVGIPLGIIYLRKKDQKLEKYDARSGLGSNSVIPKEAKGWSWGAAGLGIIWGLYNHVYLSLLYFVPYLNWIWWIVMGIKGKEWAWSSNYWESVEEFERVQKKWNKWGLIFFILPFVVLALVFIAAGLRLF